MASNGTRQLFQVAQPQVHSGPCHGQMTERNIPKAKNRHFAAAMQNLKHMRERTSGTSSRISHRSPTTTLQASCVSAKVAEWLHLKVPCLGSVGRGCANHAFDDASSPRFDVAVSGFAYWLPGCRGGGLDAIQPSRRDSETFQKGYLATLAANEHASCRSV
jgi:hypothetical protein